MKLVNWLTSIPSVFPQTAFRYPLDYTKYSIVPDYFNYAGIHRPVVLYTVPQTFIDDIIVHTDINDTTGVVHYTVSYIVGEYGVVDPACHVELLDHQGVMVSHGTGLFGTLYIPEANLWWPRLTHPRPGYLYTLKVSLIDNDELLDVYRLCIGLRTLQWNSTTLLLNKKPIYLAGFGKHEDANLRGKGLDNALLVRDYNLMTWLGANSFRTSHYPYAEETLLMADQEGFMVIDESPACSLDGFDVILLEVHKAMLQEMILRDKNHPSVIMWSLANEPRTDKPEAEDYFRSLVEFTRGLDNSRPITFVTSQGVHSDKAVQYMDIVCVNRYRAWYSDPGRLDLISYQVERELTNWHDRFKKPVLVTEYGAGAISGMHVLPAVMWTEDYLMLTLKQHFPVFDKLRGEGFLLGEMIWNFADFQTPQEVIRPVHCVKGLFTRDRQPKMAAHLTRWRYWSLAANMTGIALPADLMFIGVP
uniref:Beta-glucuronidase n=1 Tax=Timema genevievae TaxID=629358 RepID=A0A7R9K132_TIMGE|nr:unnamed protein product [Timema genevievae]